MAFSPKPVASTGTLKKENNVVTEIGLSPTVAIFFSNEFGLANHGILLEKTSKLRHSGFGPESVFNFYNKRQFAQFHGHRSSSCFIRCEVPSFVNYSRTV